MESAELKTIGAPLWAGIRKALADLRARVDNIHDFTYVYVDSLPTASEDTMNKLYFVPDEAQTDSVNEWITIADTSTSPTSYSWQKVGATGDVLVGITQEEFNAIFN